jgi:hypothetical protein
MACRLAFAASWQEAFHPAFRKSVYVSLFQERPPALRRGFRRELRRSLLFKFWAPFQGGMLLHMNRAYPGIMDEHMEKCFARHFEDAFRWAYMAAFVKAFRRAYP